MYFASSLGGSNALGNWNAARKMAGSHPEDAFVHKIHVKNSDIEIDESGQIKARTDFNGNFCELRMDADGNIVLESSQTITLKTKAVIIDAETQIDMKSPQIANKTETAFNVKSPAVNIDASDGHIRITSRSGNSFY